jgi:hypothetical protein
MKFIATYKRKQEATPELLVKPRAYGFLLGTCGEGRRLVCVLGGYQIEI